MTSVLRAALVTALTAAATPALAQPAVDELRIIAPAAPGGGWDQTARAMQQALQRAGLVRIAPVENVPGRGRHDRARALHRCRGGTPLTW